MYSYLKRRKQNEKIEYFYSKFEVLLSGVSRGSILDPILFNTFLNDLLFYLKNSKLHNFANDNMLLTISRNENDLIQTLEQDSNLVVEWSRKNTMIVNPDKFQVMLLQKSNKN